MIEPSFPCPYTRRKYLRIHFTLINMNNLEDLWISYIHLLNTELKKRSNIRYLLKVKIYIESISGGIVEM